MAEKLVIISDEWGVKNGLWVTSYLGYLQQYFDIVYYDSQQLADIEQRTGTLQELQKEYLNGGIATAVVHLLAKQQEPAHYLAFGIGSVIAWKANLQGLPMKSLYTVSLDGTHFYDTSLPGCPVTALYGKKDQKSACPVWAKKLGENMKVVPGFGSTLYTDEKIIREVSQDLLGHILDQQFHY